MKCVSPAGVGTAIPVEFLAAGGQWNQIGSVSYRAPILLDVIDRQDNSASRVLVVSGSSFGPNKTSDLLQVSLSSFNCSPIQWVSDEQLMCGFPAVLDQVLRLTVVAGG